MNKATFVREALRALEAKLPQGWRPRLRPGPSKATSQGGPDGAIEVTSPDGVKARLVFEAKAHMFPRDVDALKDRLERYSSGPHLVIARFLTPSTRRRLEERDVNYIDPTGNIRLVLERPGIYVEAAGLDIDPLPQEEPSRSLRGPKAARIVRALCDFELPISISDLGMKAGVDVSYASRMVAWLAREALLIREPRGSVLSVRQPEMIRRWAEDYEVLTTNDARSFLDPRGIENFTTRLRGTALKYAVTGSLAAARIAPIAPPRLAMVYVEDPERTAETLDLRAVDSGANVILLAAFDPVVFDRTTKDQLTTFVAPSQAAVDLLTGPGRAPAEAEAVLEWIASGRET